MTLFEAGILSGVPAGAAFGAIAGMPRGVLGAAGGLVAGSVAGGIAGVCYAMGILSLIHAARPTWKIGVGLSESERLEKKAMRSIGCRGTAIGVFGAMLIGLPFGWIPAMVVLLGVAWAAAATARTADPKDYFKRELEAAAAEQGPGYAFLSTGLGTGEVRSSSGTLKWRTRPPRGLSVGFLSCPDFIVAGEDDKEVLRVQRDRRFPLPGYSIMRDGSTVGRISKGRLLTSSYAVDLGPGERWHFQIPFLSVEIRVRSGDGSSLAARFESEAAWRVRMEEGPENDLLACALAFIQRERNRS